MQFLAFLRDNARWLAGGFLLTYFSSFGQTFFISLSAGDIRAEYGLSHGGFGIIYMLATLASALTLPWLGRLLDTRSARSVALAVIPVLALACVLMAASTQLVLLVAAIYLLRLAGQGMMSQIAFTAAGRWFQAQRGKAMSVTAIGVNAGEASMPFLFVLAAGSFGWRNAWYVAAAIALLVALPLIAGLLAVERTPRGEAAAGASRRVRDWTRGEALRDVWYYVMLAGVMAPAFVGTTVFFHSVYLVELRGWSLEAFATSFTVMAAMTVTFALISGQLVDRFSAVRMLPAFLVPLGLACILLALVEAQWSVFAFMALMGVTYGFSSTIFGAAWPEVYGTAHLGAIRAATVAFAVFATAAGPGLTGWLIDGGIGLPVQIAVMGAYCFAVCPLLLLASRRISLRLETGERAE